MSMKAVANPVRTQAAPRSPSSSQPELEKQRPWQAFSFANIPVFPPSGNGPMQGVPAFYDGQVFSTQVAGQAVSGAKAGNFPFGDQISAETGGAVNPHKVPATVVDRLPGLGVCYGGKVALRRGVGIDVARHELAHAQGADESTAQRASRDPSVLRSLGRRSPVNGWNIGFEFQTVREGGGGSTGFKTLQNNEWVKYSDHDTYAKSMGWHVYSDGGDLEAVTDHTKVPETQAGRDQLIDIMDDVTLTVASIPTIASAANKSPDQVGKCSQLTGLTMTPNGQTREDAGVRLLRTAEVKAHPQTTMGLTLDKLLEMMKLMTVAPEATDVVTQKQHLAQQIGWSDTDMAARSKRNTAQSIQAAETYLQAQNINGLTSKLAGFLTLIGTYIRGGAQNFLPTYGKEVTPFMSRTDMTSSFNVMSGVEQNWFKRVVTDDRQLLALARAMGWPEELNQNLFRIGTKEGLDTTKPGSMFSIKDWLVDFSKIGGSDRLQTALAAPNQRTFVGFSSMGRDNGATVVEFRKLRNKVPLAQWKQFALASFDLLTLVKNGERFGD